MLGDAEEEVEGQLAAVVEHGDPPAAVERRDAACGDERDPRSANAASSASEVSGDGGIGVPNGDKRDLAGVAGAAGYEVVVQQQGGFARRRWALVGRVADSDDRPSAREVGQEPGQTFGAGDRVELVARLGESGRGIEVVVGAECDDQDVRLVDTNVGRDPRGPQGRSQ